MPNSNPPETARGLVSLLEMSCGVFQVPGSCHFTIVMLRFWLLFLVTWNPRQPLTHAGCEPFAPFNRDYEHRREAPAERCAPGLSRSLCHHLLLIQLRTTTLGPALTH